MKYMYPKTNCFHKILNLSVNPFHPNAELTFHLLQIFMLISQFLHQSIIELNIASST